MSGDESEHVLIAATGGKGATSDHYHRPDPENPDEPLCDTVLQKGSEWTSKDPDKLAGFKDLCKTCENGGTPPGSGRPPEFIVANELDEMDPDDLGAEVRADD